MNSVKSILLATLTTSFGLFAGADEKAGMFIEPALTYEQGTMTLSYPLLPSSNETVKGLGVGAKFGFHVGEIFILGLDARYSQPGYESSALGDSTAAQAYNLGATAGVQTPLAGIRLWGTYLIDGQLNPGTMKGTDVKFTNLTGYRLGAGVYVAMVSLNLEYQEARYGSTTLESLGGFASGSNFDSVNGTNKSWIASASFPISL